MESETARPNIRIEIKNNLVEPMDVDDEDDIEEEKPVDSDFEDGEISDNKKEPSEENTAALQAPATINNRTWGNTDGGFTTGVDIFDKKEQEKLVERANRFGLNPDEISNFTDQHLQQLHASLGITVDNEKNIRFEAVHMRGTDDMSTEDVFEYFGKYGPAYIEWINDESCNVVWQDKISAARALHFVSRMVKGMPIEGPCDPFVKNNNATVGDTDDKSSEKEDSNEGQSILLINQNRQVQLEKEDAEMVKNDKQTDYNSAAHISDITLPIPPGYWRLGIEHPKTKCVILRFAFKTDKKPLRAERFSEYYKKYGNPNFGGMRGLISESRRMKFKGIFDRNKDIKKPIEDGKNPWGDLAENWNQDEQFCEKIFEPSIRAVTNYNSDKPDVMKRLGAKRAHETDSESTGSQENVKKKSHVPRMRMYADEEENKLKRKKQLLAVKLLQNPKSKEDDLTKLVDLRSMIGTTVKKPDRPVEQRDSLMDENDLGTKLKNRTRINEKLKHSYSKSEALRRSARKPEEQLRQTRVKRLESGRRRSPSENARARHRRESPPRRLSTKHDYDRSRYKNRLRSDRYERRRRSFSDEGFDQQKPKSKVAVVIKKQRRPTVASTIWSRINPKKERLKTASERLQPGKDSSSSSESSSDTNSSSSSMDSSLSDSSSESEDESNDDQVVEPPQPGSAKTVERPGFKNNAQSSSAVVKRKSPLRIEISNDHFKEE